MAFLTPGAAGQGVPRAEINMIPLIDVMLVLLVIFMVTAPLLTHAVKLDLPRASSQPKQAEHKVEIAVDAAERYYWNGQALSAVELAQRLAELGRTQPETEVHLHADASLRYALVAELMSRLSRAGLQRISFVTEAAAGG